MRRRAAPAGTRQIESMRSELTHGLRTARTTPFVLPLFAVVAMAELTYGAQTVQLVLYASKRLDAGAAGYGYLLAVAGLGGLLSATVNHRLAASTKVAGIVVVAGGAFCATQLAYAWTTELALALAVTLIGGAGFVACEVVAETALARVVRSEVLGRVMGVFDATLGGRDGRGRRARSRSWSPRTSLRTSFLVLGIATVVVTVACLAGLRRLGELSRKRAELLASRLAVIERLPITVGAPRIVLEQLASASQLCPLPPGVDVVVEGAPAHAFYAVVDGSVLVHRNDEEVARHRARWLVRRARPARQRSQERDRHDRGAEHDPAHRGRRAARRAPICPNRVVGDRSLQQGAVAGAPVAEEPTSVVDDPAWEPA